jgi:hypothetical protein
MLAATLFGQALQRARTMDSGLRARNWQGEIRVLDDGAAASLLGFTVVTAVVTLTVAASLLTAWMI